MKKSLIPIYLVFLIVFVGCQSEISNSDNDAKFNVFIGKKFIVKSEFFVIQFHDRVIKERIIEVPNEFSGLSKRPTIKQFQMNPQSTYLFMENKVIGLKKKGHSFVVKNVMYYRKGTSNIFFYFIIESLKDNELYAIFSTSFNHGVKNDYIELIQYNIKWMNRIKKGFSSLQGVISREVSLVFLLTAYVERQILSPLYDYHILSGK